MNAQPQPLDPIDQAAADRVVEPILRDLEQTAVASAHLRSRLDGPSTPAGEPRQGSAEAFLGLVDLGLRVMELFCSRSRRVVAELLGADANRGSQPVTTTATAPASARGAPAPSTRRSVASALVVSGTSLVSGTMSPTGGGARPAQVVEVDLVVTNRTARPLYSLRFRSTDLIAPAGSTAGDWATDGAGDTVWREPRIPASAVTFEPSLLHLAPKVAERLRATVDVPPGTEPGRYAGRVEAVGVPAIHTIIEVEVGRQTA